MKMKWSMKIHADDVIGSLSDAVYSLDRMQEATPGNSETAEDFRIIRRQMEQLEDAIKRLTK